MTKLGVRRGRDDRDEREGREEIKLGSEAGREG